MPTNPYCVTYCSSRNDRGMSENNAWARAENSSCTTSASLIATPRLNTLKGVLATRKVNKGHWIIDHNRHRDRCFRALCVFHAYITQGQGYQRFGTAGLCYGRMGVVAQSQSPSNATVTRHASHWHELRLRQHLCKRSVNERLGTLDPESSSHRWVDLW